VFAMADETSSRALALCIQAKDTSFSSNVLYNPICWRFPQQKTCACTRPCRKAVPTATMHEIIPRLYVGPIECAYDIYKLYEPPYRIRAIVNCTNETYTEAKNMFGYLKIPVEDDTCEDITRYFNKSNEFIERILNTPLEKNKNQTTLNEKNDQKEALPEEKNETAKNTNYGGVLVHCKAGISRSPSFIIAYLIWKRHISFDKAYDLVGKVHPLALPNSSFQEQLRRYEKSCIPDETNKCCGLLSERIVENQE